jgi:hypothetical protein
MYSCISLLNAFLGCVLKGDVHWPELWLHSNLVFHKPFVVSKMDIDLRLYIENGRQ